MLVAFEADEKFDDEGGIVGLSYPSLARHRPTFIETLIEEKVISKYAYGMNLNLIQENRSFVTFGDDDPNFYSGELTEYKVNGGHSIVINIDSLEVGGSGKI